MKEYRLLLPYLKPQWLLITFGLALIFMSASFEGLSIAMLYPVIDKVFNAGITTDPPSQGAWLLLIACGQAGKVIVQEALALPRDLQWVAQIKHIANTQWLLLMQNFSRRDVLLFLCQIAMVVVLLQNSLDYLRGQIFVAIGQRMISEMRLDLYRHLQKFSLAFFNRQKSGDLISRLINDVEMLNNFSVKNVAKLIKDVASVVIFLTVAFIVSARLTLMVILFLPPIFLIVGRVLQRLRSHSRKSLQKIADLTYIIQETLSSIRIVKAFAMEDYEIARFKAENERYRKAIIRVNRNANLIRPLSTTMANIVAITLLWYGGSTLIEQISTISTGQFFVFLGALFSTIKPIKEIGQTLGDMKRGGVAIERFSEMMAREVDIQEIPNPKQVDTVRDHVRFERAGFAYTPDTPVLSDISFRANKGEVTAVVGPSGAGKSTLVDLIPRFYDVTAGAIYIDDINIRELSLKSVRNLMGIVTQETILFNDTIFNNIAYGVKNTDPERVYTAAKAANAHKFITEFKDGYETSIGERGVRLSGGQRQRLAIARALFKNPPILIFDEATSALDSESEQLVQEAIDRLMENRTVFVIAHRLSTIRHADRILVIDQGRLVDQGRHDELMARDGLYRKLCEMQFRG